MNRLKTLAATLLAAAFSATQTLAQTPLYHLVQTIPLGAPTHWDYLHFDAPSSRVFISHGDEVTVVSARTDKIIGELGPLPGSHGIAVDPATGLIYADSAANSVVEAFDPKTFKPVSSAPVLLDADGVSFDPASRKIFVSGGDGDGFTPVSTITGKAGPAIALGSSPEFHVADGLGSLYVDLVDENQIARIDTKTDTIIARWPLGACQHPKGLAIDAKDRLLFASCASGVLVAVNADSGAVVATLPIGKGTDAARYDPVRHRALASCGDGTLMVVSVLPGRITELGRVKTALGARTMALDPKTGNVFLVTARVTGAAPGGAPHYKFAPNSLELLIYAPNH